MAQSSTEPAPPKSILSIGRLLFVGSNILIGILFAIFAYEAFSNWRATGQVQSLILAFQELLIVGLTITRRSSIVESHSAWDWAMALMGTVAPLLQRPGPALDALVPIGLGLQLAGAILATLAIMSLGRSFGIVAANRGVRTSGFYRFVRHPLYGSYLIGYIGFLLGDATARNLLLMVITFLCQYARAVAEEHILLQDSAYQTYVQRVRYRFIPYIF